MENTGSKNKMESGFTIKNLLLVESNFKRIPNVTFNNTEIKHKTNVEVSVGVNGNNIIVTEKVDFNQSFNDIDEITCSITMIGVFEKIGDSPLEDLERFGKINGAAIIFPYIREHLTNLSVKAGINPVILPPQNFVN